eukprot:Gb_15086 [translate_table: standard]
MWHLVRPKEWAWDLQEDQVKAVYTVSRVLRRLSQVFGKKNCRAWDLQEDQVKTVFTVSKGSRGGLLRALANKNSICYRWWTMGATMFSRS